MGSRHVRPSRRWLVAAALFAACVDGPTALGRSGELRVRPSFAAGDEPAAVGLAVDSTRVRVRRAGGDGALLVDTTLAFVSDTTSMGWFLSLTADQEAVRVEMELWSDGQRVYAGERTSTVRDAATAAPAVDPVDVAYVGPDVVATVTVSPATVTLDAAGETAVLTAEARDRHGALLPDAPVTWSSSAADVASVDAATGEVTAVSGGTAIITATSGAASGTASVTVSGNADVASIVVLPAAATLDALGATRQFTAEARDADGNVLEGVTIAWSSSAMEVATIAAASGLATATGHGATTISASANGVAGSATLTVALTSSVTSIVVTPSAATLTATGASQQFAAEARDAAGAVVPGIAFTWSSGTSAVATIDAASGLATAVAHGATTITASAGEVSGTATLTVVLGGGVASVVVTPTEATLSALGGTQQFTAVAYDASGAVVPVAGFTWASAAPAVAAVDAASGVATATGHGIATITATVDGASGAATISVDLLQTVASVSVTPAEASLTLVGATQPFAAEARDAADAVVPGVPFTWTSSTPAVATIDAASGLATAVAHGATTITASAGAVSGTAALSVSLGGGIASVVVTPAQATLTALGATQQFTAVAYDASGAVVPVAGFAWTSAAPAVATVDATSGLATATGHGITTISATVAGVTGTASLAVDLSQTVATITVTPDDATLTAVGATQQFTATARDAAGAVVPGILVTWTSSAVGVATIDAASGLAVAVAHGVTSITASAGAVSGTAALTVDLTSAVASIVVTPDPVTLTALGATQQFTAVALDAAGVEVPVAGFAWTSTAPAVATIDAASGLATATGHGLTTITATVAGVTGSSTLTVELSQTVATIDVTPTEATLTAVGATRQFTATARDAAGAVVPGIPFTWTSSMPAVATIDAASGLAIAVAHGTTTITATANGIVGDATLLVDLSTHIETVLVTPDSVALTAVGATQQFTAMAYDVTGAVVPVTDFAWSSGVTVVATVEAATGLATATGHGLTSITAAVAGVTGSATLTVDLSQTVATIDVTPSAATLTAVGATQQFTATARDAAGAVVPGIPFTWASSAPEVATIDAASGLAIAVAHGASTVTASTGGVSGTASLNVDLSARIETIIVAPDSVELTAVGTTQQFTAVAFDAAGVEVPVAGFIWSSDAGGVATVDTTNGLATATAHGLATISAAAGGRAGTARLSVDLSALVASITVTPVKPELPALGATQQFHAEARDAGGALIPGMTFDWSTSEPSVATIDAATGLATAVGSGSTTITATAGAASGSTVLRVKQRVARVIVTPASATVAGAGTTLQLVAQAFDANGHEIAGATFSWSSADEGIATVDDDGLARAVAAGTVTIKASADGVHGYAELIVR